MDDSVLNIKTTRADGMVCVSLDIHLWSGRKRLRKEHLIQKNPKFSDLPPESLATLGSIKIADPDDLAPFSRLKRKAEKLLQSNGLPLLGTMAIPDAKIKAVREELKALQKEFDDERCGLEANYEKRLDEWRMAPKNAEWKDLIQEVPTAEAVAGRMSFGMYMCRLVAPSLDGFEEGDADFQQQMGGLKGELFKDAEAEAKLMLENYLVGKNKHGSVAQREKITRRTLRPLKRVGEKFRSFAFLDDTVEPLATLIEHILSTLPSEGPIEGKDLMQVMWLCQTLSNSTTAMQAAVLCRDTASPAQVVLELGGATTTAQTSQDTQPQESQPQAHVDQQMTGLDVSQFVINSSPTLIQPSQDDSGPSFVGVF